MLGETQEEDENWEQISVFHCLAIEKQCQDALYRLSQGGFNYPKLVNLKFK